MSRKISSIVFGNLASKLVGLLREVLFAAWFGTGQTAAGFRIAQTAYLMPAQALIGDSLSAGLLPLYRKIKAEDEYHAKVLVLVAAVYGLVFSVVVSSLLYSFSHEIVGFMAPGVAPGAQSLAAKLLKIMGLSTPFFILGGMLSYIEAAFGRFGAIAWRPMLLNIGSISGAAAAVYTHQDHWLATLVFASHFVFFLWTLVQLRRLGGVWPRGRIPLSLMAHMSGRFLVSIVPLLGLPLAAQINMSTAEPATPAAAPPSKRSSGSPRSSPRDHPRSRRAHACARRAARRYAAAPPGGRRGPAPADRRIALRCLL